jgi:DNA-directed RNA polymerase specialized sigma subunit
MAGSRRGRDGRSSRQKGSGLTAGSQQEQLLKAAGRGDRRAREAVAKANLGWVAGAAAARADRGLAEADLFQEGAIALLEAIESFASSGEADFEAFARRRVAARMEVALDEERRAMKDSEMLVRAAEDYAAAEVMIERELGRRATELELAARLEWSVERTVTVGEMVAEARRRYDEDLLQYLDPEDLDFVTGYQDWVSLGSLPPRPQG